MAFRVPQQQQQRPTHLTLQGVNPQPQFLRRDSILDTPTSFGAGLTTAESEEWVVFSPSSVGADTLKTATTGQVGRSSEFGSIASGSYDEDGEERLGSLDEEEEEEEDEEDDYDIDLHGFRDPFHQGPVMLPTHDGMGSFADTSQRRSYDTTNTMQFSPPSLENSFANSRIQAWRMEQSRILLDEIERVTRGRLAMKMTTYDLREEEAAVTMGDVGDITDEVVETSEKVSVDQETFWKRLSRKIMRDIIGLDDLVLQVIFGEGVPDFDDTTPSNSPPTTREGPKKFDNRWEDRFLERLATELGVLVNQYTQHPTVSAFSTYNRNNTSLDDGSKTPQARSRSPTGLPIPIPVRPGAQRKQSHSTIYTQSSTEPLMSTGVFEPTIQLLQDEHAANWGIDDRPSTSASAMSIGGNSEARIDAEVVRDYWEKELNVRMLFSYLKSRFSSSPPTTAATADQSTTTQFKSRSRRASQTSVPRPTSTAPNSNTNTRYTAHLPLHHHHPLIHRHPSQATNINRSPGVTKPRTATNISSGFISPLTASVSSAIGFGFPAFGGMRGGSSCASESTKQSVGVTRKGKARSKNGSSSTRHYWEVATSVGSGRSSCVGMGVWGEI